MGAEILSFRPSDDELERAWREYDRARIYTESLYANLEQTTPGERREASLEHIRLLHRLTRLLKRAEGL